ncbi:hypothetical protein Pmani_018259 [Petrolisthes manimaculis]|uniref:Uncharacterized protein n=1 Tax=Petrolisthes manimaculis TaxID=1843537 RepID=A0AAE1U8Y1_9EUCA|nr:hypothetical protein Pmani_018259 [Petrolisthes manimaculis]
MGRGGGKDGVEEMGGAEVRIANVTPTLVTSPDMSDVTESQPDVTTDLVWGSPPTWVSEGGRGGGGELGL